MSRIGLALILVFPAAAALAQPKTAKDCEAIQNPMEFNLCLASLSPVRGSTTRRVAPGPGADQAPPVVEAPAKGGGRAAKGRGRVAVTSIGTRAGYFFQDGQRMFRYPGGLVVSAGGEGRKRMSFSVR